MNDDRINYVYGTFTITLIHILFNLYSMNMRIESQRRVNINVLLLRSVFRLALPPPPWGLHHDCCKLITSLLILYY